MPLYNYHHDNYYHYDNDDCPDNHNDNDNNLSTDYHDDACPNDNYYHYYDNQHDHHNYDYYHNDNDHYNYRMHRRLPLVLQRHVLRFHQQQLQRWLCLHGCRQLRIIVWRVRRRAPWDKLRHPLYSLNHDKNLIRHGHV